MSVVAGPVASFGPVTTQRLFSFSNEDQAFVAPLEECRVPKLFCTSTLNALIQRSPNLSENVLASLYQATSKIVHKDKDGDDIRTVLSYNNKQYIDTARRKKKKKYQSLINILRQL